VHGVGIPEERGEQKVLADSDGPYRRVQDDFAGGQGRARSFWGGCAGFDAAAVSLRRVTEETGVLRIGVGCPLRLLAGKDVVVGVLGKPKDALASLVHQDMGRANHAGVSA